MSRIPSAAAPRAAVGDWTSLTTRETVFLLSADAIPPPSYARLLTPVIRLL